MNIFGFKSSNFKDFSSEIFQEPLEAQNKTHKFNEKGHSRQDSDLHRKLDCFKRQMARSDPLILIRIVAKRLQKRKRAQTIPKDVLRLAKNQTARDNYMVGVFFS